MIQGKWFAPGEDLSSEVLPVRKAVFGVPGNISDPEGWNALIYFDNHPAASGRIFWKEDAFWLEYIGVLPEFRGQHLGDLVLRLLLFKAQSHSAREVRLCCPANTEGFFSRLGFQTVSRKEETIEMFLDGNRISLDSCASCKKQNCPNRK